MVGRERAAANEEDVQEKNGCFSLFSLICSTSDLGSSGTDGF